MPSPSPFEAPFTSPAISTISMVVGTTRSGLTKTSNFSKRSSGIEIVPIFGSMVQKGKFAACAFALDKQLKSVDFPTFGNPTIPHFKAIYFNLDAKILNRTLNSSFCIKAYSLIIDTIRFTFFGSTFKTFSENAESSSKSVFVVAEK